MSRVIAFIILLLLLPVLIFISCCILIFDFGPVFFLQDRIGLEKLTFRIIKFRTMKNGEVSKLGAVLRRTGLDELPQLINIFKGEMNFIGPRPLTQYDIDRLAWNDEIYSSRWNARPGLTGMAQLSPVCDKRATMTLDRYYAKNKSALLDLKIIIYSFLALVAGKGLAQKNFFKR